MMNNNRYWLFVFACLIIGLVQVTTKDGISQWKLEQAQRYAEQRFLGYIAEARRTLKRFYYLPYLVTNDETTIRFIDGEVRLEKRIKNQLIQLDKAANTKGWYLLSIKGDLLVSSLERNQLSRKNANTIVSKIHQQGGAISVVVKNKGVTPDYFIAAPVYRASDVLGLVAVQVDLSLLTDQWFADDEAVLFQNPHEQFFLSSDNRLNADWFNDTFNSQPSITKRELYDQTHIQVWQLQGKDYLIQSIKLDDLNWRLTYLTPLTSLNQTTNWISWSVAVGCLFIMLLLIILYQRRQKKLSNLRIQKLIEESEKRLSGMINKTHVGLVLIDKYGHIHDINLMAKNYFFLSDSIISNIKAWQLFDAGNPNSTTLQLLKNLDQHQDLAEITSAETMARRSDGSYFPVLFSISTFPWHATTYYLCTVIDISKRKKAEIAVQEANTTLQLKVEERTQDLKDAQQELVESSKLAALGRMSSAITHELNQPLTGLKTLLSSNQLLMERGETKMLKANMDLVMSLIDRMTNMTSQLKSFAFQRLVKPYPVTLTDALQETLRIHQAELENIDIRVRVASNISMVLGEDARLRQVLGNLLRNAIDATQNQTSATIIVSAHTDQQRVIIKVQDNGCGVSEDQLETIFEPFNTNKKMGEGLGLGLAITANNVRDMQGTLIAKNNPDQGMTFTLTLQNIDSE